MIRVTASSFPGAAEAGGSVAFGGAPAGVCATKAVALKAKANNTETNDFMKNVVATVAALSASATVEKGDYYATYAQSFRSSVRY